VKFGVQKVVMSNNEVFWHTSQCPAVHTYRYFSSIVVLPYLGKPFPVSTQSEVVLLKVGKYLPVAMAKRPTGIQALAKISLEQFIVTQNSKYPTAVFTVVSNLWFY
jgi:hypothetical protein